MSMGLGGNGESHRRISGPDNAGNSSSHSSTMPLCTKHLCTHHPTDSNSRWQDLGYLLAYGQGKDGSANQCISSLGNLPLLLNLDFLVICCSGHWDAMLKRPELRVQVSDSGLFFPPQGFPLNNKRRHKPPDIPWSITLLNFLLKLLYREVHASEVYISMNCHKLNTSVWLAFRSALPYQHLRSPLGLPSSYYSPQGSCRISFVCCWTLYKWSQTVHMLSHIWLLLLKKMFIRCFVSGIVGRLNVTAVWYSTGWIYYT